jgi:hypothetical protein
MRYSVIYTLSDGVLRQDFFGLNTHKRATDFARVCESSAARVDYCGPTNNVPEALLLAGSEPVSPTAITL